jgi:Tripartite tricarboxylate transporter family receptor
VPTTREGGLPQFQASSWNAIFAPKNLSPDVQAKLNTAVVKALDDQAARNRLLDLGCVIPDKADRPHQALQEQLPDQQKREDQDHILLHARDRNERLANGDEQGRGACPTRDGGTSHRHDETAAPVPHCPSAEQ